MTFNIRYDDGSDGPLGWRQRREAAAATVRAHRPDLLAVQEAMEHQAQDILAALPGWTMFGPAGEEWDDLDPPRGFFRSDRFAARASGVFWLSDTPSVARSVSFANDYGARACAWVALTDRASGRELVFASTHFDTNQESTLPSARVLHAELDAAAGAAATIVAGDFNSPAGSEAHAYLTAGAGYRDAWTEAGHGDAGVVTFNHFVVPHVAPALDDAFGNFRIDWILFRGALKCASSTVDDVIAGALPPSDHYPVVANVVWVVNGKRARSV
ncbi:MAG TPA: endonuclease/exonuclease/phosphatase family protein [Vicinamibacterales bacterium]|nr:endonuclease/exonuclease/phosphatase family protein [Vicinamibacterales bacterium]